MNRKKASEGSLFIPEVTARRDLGLPYFIRPAGATAAFCGPVWTPQSGFGICGNHEKGWNEPARGLRVVDIELEA